MMESLVDLGGSALPAELPPKSEASSPSLPDEGAAEAVVVAGSVLALMKSLKMSLLDAAVFARVDSVCGIGEK